MGSIFTAGFGILLLLLRTNWILRSLNKMIEDKEMKEILDEMKKEDEGEEESDVGSGNNDDFVELKERSHVPADSETSSAPAVASGRERLLSAMIPQGKAPVSDEKGEMRCFELDCCRILMVVLTLSGAVARLLGAEEMIVPLFTRRRMGRRKKRNRTGRSMEEDD